MPKLLTTKAQITCPHSGQGTSTPAGSTLLYAGGGVLTDGDQGTIAGCTYTQVPCASYQLASLQLNSMYVSGKRVMLVTDFVQSNTGYPLTVTESHQIFDQTVPAALAPGATPVTPPELREDDHPSVAVAPPTLAFSQSGFANSGSPAALPFVFTLSSQYPRRWTLFRTGPMLSGDIATGIPTSITVVPAGGAWSTPALTVSVTVTGTFANTLAIGTHTFVLTAVNHRGLWGMAEATLTVSA
jgi:hypothetical protein